MNGNPANVTIPSTLESGQYLIRHEIIALHLATTLGGAEFYPSCTQVTPLVVPLLENRSMLISVAQVNISGSQVGVASSSEEVTFPGGYSDTDPGIYDPDVFDTPVQYTFPGPPVAAFVSGSSSSSSGSGSGSGSPSSSSPGSSSTPSASPTVASQGGATCALRQQTFAVHKRRSISRVMAAWIRSIRS